VQEHLAERLRETGSHGPQVAVLLFDLDNLKYFNDSFGHHLGDRAIKTVATALDGHRRLTDLCARYAGDEFIVVLWDCAAGEALDRARAMQDEVARISIDVGMGQSMRLAVSVGVAVFPEDGATGDALIAAADQRMYLDKAQRKRLVDPAVAPDAA
jgi:diguanylate cyclase (GGDEF)-like protein